MAKTYYGNNSDGQPIMFDKEAIWHKSYGKMNDNGAHSDDTGVQRTYRYGSGLKEINRLRKKSHEYQIIDEKGEEKDGKLGKIWLITFLDKTDELNQTIQFQLDDLYARGGRLREFNYSIGGL